tara:strand:- start:9021 stop:9242 length:222 start_codon:yes stop_codon:yes gene_type:complete
VLVMLHELEVTELQGSSSACEWTLCQDLHLPNDGAPAIHLMGLMMKPDCSVFEFEYMHIFPSLSITAASVLPT